MYAKQHVAQLVGPNWLLRRADMLLSLIGLHGKRAKKLNRLEKECMVTPSRAHSPRYSIAQQA